MSPHAPDKGIELTGQLVPQLIPDVRRSGDHIVICEMRLREVLRLWLSAGAIAWVAMALAQCTVIDRPLSSRAGGFFDEELVGEYTDDDTTFSITSDGELELLGSELGQRVIFEVWSTEIEGRRYLNFPYNRPRECFGCDEEEYAQAMNERAAVFPILYATETAALDGPRIGPRHQMEDLQQREGEWVAYAWMTTDFSAQAVESGLIEGECEGPCGSNTGVRLTAGRRELQSFVAQHVAELYPEWNIAWRQRAQQ